MIPTVSPKPAVLCRHFLAAALAVGASLSAQTAREPAPTSRTNAMNETVVLTPFQVNTTKDAGYAAASSLAGGRADTPLKLTPASISVMTKEFMQDFNVLDMRDAAQWTLNMEGPQNPTQGPFGSDNFQMNFRNTGGSANYPSRNYALFYFTADAYNSERFEFSRGPNALLFGDAGRGGMATQLTKQAHFHDRRGEVALQADSYGGWRGTLDQSYGVDRFAIRLNGLLADRKGYQNDTWDRTNAFHVAASFKLTDSTQVRAEVERHAEHALLWRKLYAEQASLWNRTTFNENNSTIANPNSFGIEQVSGTADYLLFNTTLPNLGLLNYTGNQYRSRGLGYPMLWDGRTDVPNFARPPSKEFNLGPADAAMRRVLNYRAIYLDHRFTPELFTQLAYIRHDFGPRTEVTESLGGEYRIDVNKLLPNGQPNTNVGKPYADVDQSSQYQANMVDEVRFLSSYQFSRKEWFDLKQRFSLIGGWRLDRFNMWQRRWVWANNPAQPNLTNAANRIRYRIYWDQPMPKLGANVPPVDNSGRQFRFVDTGFSADNERYLTYAQAVSNTTFFDDRLSLLLGYRRDKVEEHLQNSAYDSTGRFMFGYTNPATKTFQEGFEGRNNVTVDSKNFGAVYMVRPWLGVLGNYSENFSIPPTGDPLIDGTMPAPPRGQVKDIGLQFWLPDNKLFAKITYYDSEQIGSIVGGGNQNEIRAIWTNLGYSDPTKTNLGYRDLQSIAAKGWEFEVTANPTRNVRLTANYSRPERMTIVDSPGRIAYFAANRAEWDAGAALPAGATVPGTTRVILDPGVIKTNIQTMENGLNGLTPGTMANATLKYSANLAASYVVTEGSLRGFSFGGGGQSARQTQGRQPRRAAQVQHHLAHDRTDPGSSL
jgi:outer membrane receptor for ferric coprogen and ferric-rhodotorulic acid